MGALSFEEFNERGLLGIFLHERIDLVLGEGILVGSGVEAVAFDDHHFRFKYNIVRFRLKIFFQSRLNTKITLVHIWEQGQIWANFARRAVLRVFTVPRPLLLRGFLLGGRNQRIQSFWDVGLEITWSSAHFDFCVRINNLGNNKRLLYAGDTVTPDMRPLFAELFTGFPAEPVKYFSIRFNGFRLVSKFNLELYIYHTCTSEKRKLSRKFRRSLTNATFTTRLYLISRSCSITTRSTKL